MDDSAEDAFPSEKSGVYVDPMAKDKIVRSNLFFCVRVVLTMISLLHDLKRETRSTCQR